jgi:ribonuclease P protein component
MSLRLSTGVRLRARREFVLVQSQGRRAAGTWFTVLARPNTHGRDRLGIIASRKLGNAVLRNRTKRRVRELFRQTQPDTALARGVQPHDFVVIPRREAARAPFEALRQDLAAQLARLDRMRRR